MEPIWSLEAWRWDPYALSACEAADAQGAGSGMASGITTAAVSDPAMSADAKAIAVIDKVVADKALNKPAKATGGTKKGHKPSCQVAGCTSDLAHSRAYYRRYRICENHFRMPCMTLPTVLNGVVSRFCQQCAKFEPLTEFDSDKRSCRRQLNRHNERRKGRKGSSQKRTKQAEGGTCAGAADNSGEDDASGDSNSGRLVDGPLAELLRTSSIQRSGTGNGACDGEVFSGTGKADSRPPAPADMRQMNSKQHMMAAHKQQEQMRKQQQQPSEANQSEHVRDNTIGDKQAPVPSSAAAAEAAAGLAWPPAPHMQVGSPPVSRSEVTVEVGQSTRDGGVMDTEDGFDAVLAVAAQELLAHWQQEDITITADAGSPVTGVKAAPAPAPVEGSMDNALVGAVRAARLLLSRDSNSQLMPAGQQGAQPQLSNTSALFVKQLHPCDSAPVRSCLSLPQQRSNALEPCSADSSVHGPAAPHLMPPPCDAQPGGGQDRVLEMLGQSQCFDMIRGDAHPLVQDAAGPTFSWPQPLTTGSLLRSEGAPRQNAGMTRDAIRSSAPQAAGSHMSHPPQSPAPGQYPVIIPAAAMGREPAGLPPHVGNRQAWLSAHWANASAMPLNMQTEAALIHCAPVYPVAAHAAPPHDPALWHMPVAATRGMEIASPGTSPPQVPLHPVLANLPTANDFQRNSNDQLSAPPPQPMLARQDQAQQQQQLPQQVHYPNIWSTPCPLPVSPPASTVLYCGGAPGQPGMSLGHSGPSWMSTATPRSQSLGPNNLQRNSGGHSAVDGEGAERLGTSNNTGTLAKNLGQAYYLLTEQSLTRLSIKLHGVTPDALPHDLRAALTEWLAATDVRLLQGFIRPGCVHLTLDCMVVNKKHNYNGSTMSAMASACPHPVRGLDDLLRAGLATAGVAHMASALPRPLARLFSSCTIVELQSPGKLVLMEGEAVWNVTSLDKRPNMPVVHSVQPLAILAGSHKPQAVYLQGSHLEGRAGVSTSGASDAQQPGSCQVLVRSHGRFFQTGPGTQVHSTSENGIVLPSSALNAGGASSSEASSSKTGWWRVGVDASAMQPGLAVVECQMGRTLSNWRPVLVVDDPGVLWEVLQLQPLQAQFPEHINSIVCDLALLLQLQSGVQAQAAAVQAVRVPVQLNKRVVEETDDEDGTSDLEDVNSLTAPSISDEDDDDDDSVNNNEEEEAGDAAGAGVRLHGDHAVATAIAVGGRRVNVTQRMVSWDSDTFQDVDTPNMHSSWGSTFNGGPLTAAVAAGATAAVPTPVGSLGGTTDMDMARSFASRNGGDSSGSSDGASDAAAPTPAAAGTGGTSRPSAPALAAAASVGAGSQADAISFAFSPEVRMSLAARALRLLAFAADACWPCTTRLLLDLLTTLPLMPEAGAAAGRLVPIDCQTVLTSTIGGEGFTLLHMAARSGSAATVKEVLSFARSAGLVLNPASRGEAGLSALHLAAQSLEAGMSVALVLLTASRDAPLQWFVSRCADGLTPAQYAACQAGGPQVNEHARHLVQQLATYARGDRQSV